MTGPARAIYLDTDLRLTLQSELAEIDRARLALLRFLAPVELPERTIYRIELIVEEVLSNIVRHAFTESSESTIGFCARLSAGDVVIEFEDHGRQFNPLEAAELPRASQVSRTEVGGWGISLMRRFADGLRYERRDGRNLLEVRIAPDPH